MIFALSACERPKSGDAGTAPSSADPPADAAVADPEIVRFNGADGWQIVGDFRMRRRAGLAVLFVHQLSSNRGEWARFATRLAGPPPWAPQPGTISTLAIDLRGHGQSTSGPEGNTSWTTFGNDRARWLGAEHDVAAGIDLLRQRVSTTRMVIIASGIGATAATLFAARSGAPVTGLVLLSPAREARGIDLGAPLAQYVRGRGRVLLVAATGDTISADSVRDLQQHVASSDAGAGVIEVERYDNASAHGVSLGAEGVHPELWARIERFVSAIEAQPR